MWVQLSAPQDYPCRACEYTHRCRRRRRRRVYACVCVPFARSLCVENVAESRSQPRCLKCACALRCRVRFCVSRTLCLVRSCAQFPREHRRAALHSIRTEYVGYRRVCPCPRPTGVSAVGLLFSTQRRRPSAAHHNRVVARRASTAIALRTQRHHNYANYCFTMRTEVCYSTGSFYQLSGGRDVIDKPMDLESPPIKDCHSPTTPTSPPLLHHLQQQVPHFPTVTSSTPYNMPPSVQFPSTGTNNSTNTTSSMTSNVNTMLAVSTSEPDHEAAGPLATLNQEEMRRKTFTSAWPHNFLDTNLLAQTGFYFIGPNDTVKCFFCKVEIGRWETDDNEVTEHQRWSQNCPLLKRRVTNNQPLDAAQLERVLPPVTIDVCGPGGIDVRHNTISEGSFDVYPTMDAVPAVPATTYAAHSSVGQDLGPQVHHHNHHHHHHQQLVQQDAQLQQPSQQNGNQSFSLAVQSAPSMRPDHPEYAIESARLRSFEDWPKTMKQKPQDLSDAGFFYTMKGDRVKCFSCGGGLRDWDENDVPWEQHAQWFRHCQYLQLIKGPEYIEEVLRLAGQTATRAAEAQSVAVAASTAASSESTVEPASATAAALGADDVNGPGGRKICDSKLCKICYSCEYNTAFLPCGHVVACAKCASSVSKCPMCRKPFERVMRVYFS